MQTFPCLLPFCVLFQLQAKSIIQNPPKPKQYQSKADQTAIHARPKSSVSNLLLTRTIQDIDDLLWDTGKRNGFVLVDDGLALLGDLLGCGDGRIVGSDVLEAEIWHVVQDDDVGAWLGGLDVLLAESLDAGLELVGLSCVGLLVSDVCEKEGGSEWSGGVRGWEMVR